MRLRPHGSGFPTCIGPFRLAHHETVIHHPVGLLCDELLALIGLIDPLAREWIRGVSHVDEVLRTSPLG